MTDTTGPVPPTAAEFDATVIAAAKDAGMTSPAQISDTHFPSVGELHARVQELEAKASDALETSGVWDRLTQIEAMLHHVFSTNYRNVNIGEIVDAFKVMKAGSPVIDETVKGRP